MRRLFPPAYPDDPERDAGYQVLTRDELLEQRLAALDVVERTLDGGDLDTGEMTAWMGTLNSLRLVLGTRLDVDEELPDLDPADPRRPRTRSTSTWAGSCRRWSTRSGSDLPPPSADVRRL